jgi:hypothetical protein
MATLHAEDVPDDEKMMDVTSISVESMPFDHGKDAGASYVTSFLLPVNLGFLNNSLSHSPETKATATTTSPSMLSSSCSDSDVEHDSHNQNTLSVSFQSVKTHFGNACESFLSQANVGKSDSPTPTTNSETNNEEYNLPTTEEEETQPPLAAESSSTINETNTANNSTNEEIATNTNGKTLRPSAVVSTRERLGVVSRQDVAAFLLTQRKFNQKLSFEISEDSTLFDDIGYLFDDVGSIFDDVKEAVGDDIGTFVDDVGGIFDDVKVAVGDKLHSFDGGDNTIEICKRFSSHD